MKLLLIASIVAAACAGNASAQQAKASGSTLQEVKHRSHSIAAPRECLATLRQMFTYLRKAEPNIIRDEAAQKRWLSKDLREALMRQVATFTNPEENHDLPSNSTFVGSWDYPTTYSIVSSRRYGQRAVVDVLYKWGPNTNYPGDERTSSFIFVLEDGVWKLDDIYTFKGEFVSAGSLSEELRTRHK